MWFTDQWFELASLQELLFIWITAFWKGTLGQCCKHLPGSEMLCRWTRKVGWPKPTRVLLPDKVKSMTWKIVSQEAQLPGISFTVCLPTHLTHRLLHVLEANCPLPLFQRTGPPLKRHIWEEVYTTCSLSNEILDHIPHATLPNTSKCHL